MRLLREQKKKDTPQSNFSGPPSRRCSFPSHPAVFEMQKKKKSHFPHKVAFKKAKILLGADPLHSQASKSTTHKVPVTASSCFPMWSTQWPKEEQKES